MKPTLKLCSSHSATGISKTLGLVTSLEPVPLLFRARGTTRESWIEGAKHTKHTQREGLYDPRIRCRGVGHTVRSSSRLLGGGVCPGRGMCIPARTGADPPPRGQTDTCKKHNLRNFVAGGKNGCRTPFPKLMVPQSQSECEGTCTGGFW